MAPDPQTREVTPDILQILSEHYGADAVLVAFWRQDGDTITTSITHHGNTPLLQNVGKAATEAIREALTPTTR